jgi:hypothetical protein
MKLILTLTGILTLIFASGQQITWEKVKFSPIPVNTNPDSTVIIVTNRECKTDQQIFFTDRISPEKKLYYSVVTCNNGIWTSFLVTDKDSILKYTDTDLNTLFYVHGDGKSFTSNLQACIRLRTLYKINLIAFDYPSYLPDAGGLKNFYNSRSNIRNSLDHFSEFIAFADHAYFKNGKNRSIMFHSLGNYLLRKHITEKKQPYPILPVFDNLIVNAAAVKTSGHRKWVEKTRIQRRIYVTSNKNDWTLKGAGFITLSRQLGGNLRKPVAKNANYLNFTNIAGQAHNCFIDRNLITGSNQVFSFYNSVLNGQEYQLNEETNVTKRKDGLGYDLR